MLIDPTGHIAGGGEGRMGQDKTNQTKPNSSASLPTIWQMLALHIPDLKEFWRSERGPLGLGE